MAFTTLTQLVADIAAMSVTGVASGSRFAYRPRRINAAMMPLLYTRPPSRKRETTTLGYSQGLKQASVEIVIMVQMMGLSTQALNDALTLTLTDALGDALETNASTLGMDEYEIVTDEDTIDDGATAVQVLVATVEVSG